MPYVKKTDNPRMGRPKTNRNVRLGLRLTDDENQMLEECSRLTGETRTEVIVKGVALLYERLK